MSIKELASLILGIAFAGGLNAKDSAISSTSIEKDIATRGGKAVLNGLYQDDKSWTRVLSKVSKGDKEGLEIYVALKPWSDAGTSEMLNIALSNALMHDPSGVLNITNRDNSEILVCGTLDDDANPNTYPNTLEQRKLKVLNVNDPQLHEAKEKCLKAITDAYIQLVRNKEETPSGRTSKGVHDPQKSGLLGAFGSSGYGSSGIGAKKNAALIAGDEPTIISGTIDKEAVRRVVQANLKQIKRCYEKGLNREPGLHGKIVIQYTVGPGGEILDAGIKSTTMNSSEVENCSVSCLRTWKFPEPSNGEAAVMTYPFVFQVQE